MKSTKNAVGWWAAAGASLIIGVGGILAVAASHESQGENCLLAAKTPGCFEQTSEGTRQIAGGLILGSMLLGYIAAAESRRITTQTPKVTGT